MMKMNEVNVSTFSAITPIYIDADDDYSTYGYLVDAGNSIKEKLAELSGIDANDIIAVVADGSFYASGSEPFVEVYLITNAEKVTVVSYVVDLKSDAQAEDFRKELLAAIADDAEPGNYTINTPWYEVDYCSQENSDMPVHEVALLNLYVQKYSASTKASEDAIKAHLRDSGVLTAENRVNVSLVKGLIKNIGDK